MALLDSVLLNGEVLDAFDALKSGYEDMQKVQDAVKSIQNGVKPDVNFGTDWNTLANKFNAAATTIAQAPLVTDFDASPYAISLDQMSNCYNFDSNIATLNNYKQALQDAVNRGQDQLTQLDGQKTIISSTNDAVTYLITAFEQLGTTPIFQEVFQWNWYDLETSVTSSLGNYSSAVNNQEIKLKNSIATINTEISNLSSNISLIQNSLCQLSGTYSGSASLDGEEITISLQISKIGNSFTGSINIGGEGILPISNFLLNSNKFISFSVSDDGDIDTFSGTLSLNYKQITNFKDTDGDVVMTLSK